MILSTLLVLLAECHQLHFHCLRLGALPVLLYKLVELIEPCGSLVTPPSIFAVPALFRCVSPPMSRLLSYSLVISTSSIILVSGCCRVCSFIYIIVKQK
jgi:hypothetical protein